MEEESDFKQDLESIEFALEQAIEEGKLSEKKANKITNMISGKIVSDEFDRLITALERERRLRIHQKNQKEGKSQKVGGRPSKSDEKTRMLIHYLENYDSSKDRRDVNFDQQQIRKLLRDIEEFSRPTELKIRRKIEDEFNVELEPLRNYSEIELLRELGVHKKSIS